jgi:dTDP-4-amino-4,6-dideoxygalactose transaminase
VIPVMRPYLGPEEAAAAAEAVASGWVAQGPRVAEFERRFAAYVGAASGVAVSSCTTGLHLVLHVLGVGPGDEVVVPSYSFIATANAVRYTGATPVFADVCEQTGNLTALTVEPVLTPRTRAVMVVHQGGMPADVPSIRALCEPRGIQVVEDAACAAGSTFGGSPVGTGALLAAWSFHPRKLLTTGEGGMITTDSPEWTVRMRRLREHGMTVSAADRHASGGAVIEEYAEVGFNYRMTDVQAAIGLVQLAKMDAMIARRRELAARYQQGLSGVDGLRVARDPDYGTTNYQSCWVLLPDSFPGSRNEVLAALVERGISARRGIMASHLEPAYRDHPHVPLPVTERLTSRTLILPLYHELTEAEQDTIVSALGDVLAGAGVR